MMWRAVKRTAFVLALFLWLLCDRAEHYSRKTAGWLEDRL